MRAKITWGPGLRACKGPFGIGDGMALLALPPGIPHARNPGRGAVELVDAVGGGEHAAREREELGRSLGSRGASRTALRLPDQKWLV